MAPPFKDAEFDIMFGEGISRAGDILDLAVKHNIIQKSGAWFSYNDQKIAPGRENAKKYLSDNPDVMDEVSDKVRALADVRNNGADADETKEAEE